MRGSRKTWRRLAAMGCTAALWSCGSGITVPQVASGVRVELEVTGGIAGVSWAVEVVGSEGVVRGVRCANGCGFEPGEVLLPLSPLQVTRLAADLEAANILELDGTDFGDQCCDQFHHELTYASGARTSTVEGTDALFPPDLAVVIQRVVAFTRGTVPAVVDLDGALSLPDAPVLLGDHTLNGDILEVDLSFGGGCERHEIDLVVTNGWLESNPVRAGAVFAHEDHDDPCDAFLTVTRSFDLRPVAAAYREAFGPAPPGETTLVLLLADADAPDGVREVPYVF